MREDFTVRLERVFHGPMDLLLHLVREQEVEITEIEIGRVIDGYMDYLKALESLDIELAGEFVVMAATLMSIKARSLLPQEEIDLAEELDPRDELIERLMEYRRFKEASQELGYRHHERSLRMSRGRFGEAKELRPERELDIGELSSWDLLATFSRLMREILAGRTHKIAGDPRPLRFYVERMADTIRRTKKTSLRDLLTNIEEEPTRETLVGSFCALLELIKIGLVAATQEDPEGDIQLDFSGEEGVETDELLRSARFDGDDDEEGEDGGELALEPEPEVREIEIEPHAPPAEAGSGPDSDPDPEDPSSRDALAENGAGTP